MTSPADAEICPGCEKPVRLCVCAALQPIDTRLKVLLLQHPQEKREVLGTAGLATRLFPKATMKVGLSWPGLRRLVGENADAKRWGVLYLGAAKQSPGAAGANPQKSGGANRQEEVAAVDKNGVPLKDSAHVLADLEGIILLDGTWAQAKTLWWRNAWLLKCRRIVLNPKVRSLYGQARKEPRRESLSTLESAALLLSRLEERPELYDQALAPFALLLKKLRAPRPRPPKPAAAEGESAPPTMTEAETTETETQAAETTQQ
jgi:DTW domain-containing protein